ncbi:MAG TPA: hypothetical protein PLY93_13010, partial [Turneriella sp.]|nr:hypothetical protein [Turneriella sp.]
MEITGSSISIPRNFLFLHKLPARFEMLVIARGAAFKESTAYEVELLGQRLVLRSKVELKPGTKYELEKENALVFRIVKEKHSENDNISDRHIASETIKEAYSDFENLSFQSFYGMTNLDLLSLKAIEEEGYSV